MKKEENNDKSTFLKEYIEDRDNEFIAPNALSFHFCNTFKYPTSRTSKAPALPVHLDKLKWRVELRVRFRYVRLGERLDGRSIWIQQEDNGSLSSGE